MKKKVIIYTTLLIIFGSLITIFSCSKEKAKEAPTVRTSEVTKITEYSAECGGIVTLEGDAPVFERGICWDTIPTPNEIDCPHVKYGEGFGEYIGYLSALHDNTKYYVRAYAINNYGTGYGEIKTFTTLQKVEEDPRKRFIGVWQFVESGYKSSEGQSYIVTISKDPNNSSGVMLKNFGNPGTQEVEAKGVVASNQIVISSQQMSNGWTVSGLGKIVNVTNTTMSWTYSIKVGNNEGDYSATATKQ